MEKFTSLDEARFNLYCDECKKNGVDSEEGYDIDSLTSDDLIGQMVHVATGIHCIITEVIEGDDMRQIKFEAEMKNLDGSTFTKTYVRNYTRDFFCISPAANGDEYDIGWDIVRIFVKNGPKLERIVTTSHYVYWEEA